MKFANISKVGDLGAAQFVKNKKKSPHRASPLWTPTCGNGADQPGVVAVVADLGNGAAQPGGCGSGRRLGNGAAYA
jgi:hypothetical protein